ncbi:MAG: hypothetical protein ACI805_001917, partial [Candidatus Azotimanducaceae bacterium]
MKRQYTACWCFIKGYVQISTDYYAFKNNEIKLFS